MQVVRSGAFWLLAFAFSYAVWLGHDDSAKLPELLAGVVIAALAATGVELVRRQRVARMRFRLRFLRGAWRIVPNTIRDCAALTGAAFAQLFRPQPVRGRTVAQPFRHGGDDDPEDSARRALALGFGSFAPCTVGIGVDPDGDVVISHQLASSGEPTDADPLELG